MISSALKLAINLTRKMLIVTAPEMGRELRRQNANKMNGVCAKCGKNKLADGSKSMCDKCGVWTRKYKRRTTYRKDLELMKKSDGNGFYGRPWIFKGEKRTPMKVPTLDFELKNN